MNKPTDVDAYIAGFPPPVQKLLRQLRSIVRKAAPGAEETIAYAMPTYKMGTNLVHFAAFKGHIGFYPTPSGIASFKNELQPYVNAKGSVQFHLDQPLPTELIAKMVQFRVAEVEQKASAKQKKTAVTKTAVAKKSSDNGGLLVPGISAPAQRALAAAGIKTLSALAKYSAAQLLALHGVGPSALPKIKAALEQKGMALKNS